MKEWEGGRDAEIMGRVTRDPDKLCSSVELLGDSEFVYGYSGFRISRSFLTHVSFFCLAFVSTLRIAIKMRHSPGRT
ncbi:hypothetical protein BC830DRAFT_1105384 [Chytriomyces sp. MP71]|nr:hypothetical protein BC830DRAFT_1105384 [Chytriomyces sp. MP71]